MLVDPHVHTSFGSPDSRLSPAQLIATAKRRGIQMVCLTDHNSYRGVERAQEIGNKEGVLVGRGIEMDTLYGHVLVYGVDVYDFIKVDRSILKEQIEGRQRICLDDLREIWCSLIPSFEIGRLVDEVHSRSGAVVLAHPFGRYDLGQTTMRFYLDEYFGETQERNAGQRKLVDIGVAQLVDFVQNRAPALFSILGKIDAIEVLNPSCSWAENQAAFALAEYLGKNKIGGSDAHTPQDVGICVTVLLSNIGSVEDFVYALRFRHDMQPSVHFAQCELRPL